MADTLLALVKRILRATGQNPSITEFSDNDDSQYLVDRINEACFQLDSLKSTVQDSQGSITVTPSTRGFSVAQPTDLYKIYDWSWRVADNNTPLERMTLETVLNTFPGYLDDEASQPVVVYYDANQVCFYPLLKAGSSHLTVTYQFPTGMTRKSLPGDTFLYPDKWLLYAEKYAQFWYELYKGLAQPQVTSHYLEDLWGEISAKVAVSKRRGLQGYRRYS